MYRLILPKLAVLLILVALVGRLYQLQLVDTEANKYRYATRVRTTRFLPVRPIRGEIFASDGRTPLAESVPIFSVSIRPADLPDAEKAPRERAAVFAQLGQLLGISTTLTISPALALEQNAGLRDDLRRLLGQSALDTAGHPEAIAWATLIVPPTHDTTALKLSEAYTTTLRLENPLATQVARANIPGYQ